MSTPEQPPDATPTTTERLLSGCIAPERFWEVALGKDVWSIMELEHLNQCERCRERGTKVVTAVLTSE